MKTILLATMLLLMASVVHAEEYVFQYHRFGAITLRTTRGKERVVIDYSEKEAPVETIFKSRLTPAGSGVFKTASGIAFTLKHLPAPIINDGNRHINSGDWQLTISGQGRAFKAFRPKLPEVAFGDTPPLVYLGEKAEAQ